MAADKDIKKQLSRYRDLLANLSKQNRELYYRESTSSSVNLSRSPFAPGVCGKAKFKTLRPLDPEFDALILGQRKLDLNDHFQLDSVTKSELATRFAKRLDKVRLSDEKHQKEFGISGAWLLGPFLCWRTSASSSAEDLLISPLLKIPAKIIKSKRKRFELSSTDEALELNPSLLLALKQRFGIQLDDSIEFASVAQVAAALEAELLKSGKTLSVDDAENAAVPRLLGRYRILKDENGDEKARQLINLTEELTADELKIYETVTQSHFVLIDALYLDQLNASRAVLIHDYDHILENCDSHPILKELFSGQSFMNEPEKDRSRLRALDNTPEQENYFVVNTDSTQHRAIEIANRTPALVIQGPPGTGKSQTITNLIADCLAKGKRVLFVSEKRPALDVVYNRLKSANIESQAVLIHSSDLNKSELYKSYLELADLEPNRADEREWQKASHALDRNKQELNAYCDKLTLDHAISGQSQADVILRTASLYQKFFDPEVRKRFDHLNDDELTRVLTSVRAIEGVFELRPNILLSPWAKRQTQVIRSTALIHELESLAARAQSLIDDRDRLYREAQELAGAALTEENLAQCRKFIAWNQEQPELSERFDLLWPSPAEPCPTEQLLHELDGHLKALQENEIYFEAVHHDAPASIREELEQYYAVPRGAASWLTPQYWHFRKLMKAYCPTWKRASAPFKGFRQYHAAADVIKDLMRRLNITLTPKDLKPLEFEKITIGVITEIDNYLRATDAAKRYLSGRLLQQAQATRADYIKTVREIALILEKYETAQQTPSMVSNIWMQLERFFIQAPPLPDNVDHVPTELKSLIVESDDIQYLTAIEDRLADNGDVISPDLLRQILFDDFLKRGGPWADRIEASVVHGWMDDIISENAVLQTFDREKIFLLVKEFQKLEERHRLASQQAVHLVFAKRWCGEDSDRSGLPLLRREAGKQRRVLSPREIMERGALTTMMQLKPCWLMSPLSISQLLPLTNGLFDVIIFDEASQVRVEDAIPSIYRAKSMIVVGDNKQMPPTNFFSGAAPDDTDDDEEVIAASVLDLASQVYSSVLLEWHYRSQFEALIAFSNRAFYDGRLIAAPNPANLTSANPIQYIEVKNAYFEGKQGNQNEAHAVVEALLTHLTQNSKRSFGIIALGQPQALAIEEAIDQRIEADPVARLLIEQASIYKDGGADAGLFIKNLENVQGDERDVILLSVGYAPSAPGKKLFMNFGPLSKVGGGRRLNVAITRAKQKMVVVSSFAPESIATDDPAYVKNPDMALFGRYLQYAKAVSKNHVEGAMHILNQFANTTSKKKSRSGAFARDIKRRLEARGHTVSLEIGASGFVIDLAIHDPIQNDRYILGIECDHAITFATPYARDREKIRGNLLKQRGWNLARIYSQDWAKDWRREVARIEQALEKVAKKTTPQKSLATVE